MKILHIVQSLDPAWGGIARVLPELTTQLAKAGLECRIATLAGDRFGTPPETINGVEILSFPAKPDSRLGSSPEFNRRISDLVRETDIVHLHGLWSGQNWAAGKAIRKAGKPYIMTPHSMMMPWAWKRNAWKKRPIGWLFEHNNLRNATCLHALAEGEAEGMRTIGLNDRIEIIPNGIHVDDYQNPPSLDRLFERFPAIKNKKCVLILGRIHPQKGIVAAMKGGFDALAAAEGWHLIVAGPDEAGMLPFLQAAIARKGVSDYVTFTGMLARDEVDACIHHAKVLLQPSMSEGLSMSIVEALAGGLPVIISTACNMPEVKTEDAGRVVAPSRVVVASALRKLVVLSDEELTAMGERGRKLARDRYDWQNLTPKYQKMYERVLG